MGEELILKRSFYSAVEDFSDEQLGRLFRAIFQYGNIGISDVDADIRLAFKFFTSQFAKGEDASPEILRAKRIRWSKRNAEDFLRTDVTVPISAKREFIRRYIDGNGSFPTIDDFKKIKAMDYHDFLKTPYWKSISLFVKERDGKQCKICGSTKRLNVHHLRYNHHGDELHHTEDLMCVCKNCHTTLHKDETRRAH